MKNKVNWMTTEDDILNIYYTVDRCRGEYLQVQYKEDWINGPVLVAGDVVIANFKEKLIRKGVYEAIRPSFEGVDYFDKVITDFIKNILKRFDDFQKKVKVSCVASRCTIENIFKLKIDNPEIIYIGVGGAYYDCDIVIYPDKSISIKTKNPIQFEKKMDCIFANERYNYFFATLDDFREIGDVEICYYR